MKRIIQLSIVLATVTLGTGVRAANFQADSLVIFRMGTGAGAGTLGSLTNAGTPIFLDEYSTNGGTALSSVQMTTNYFGANSPLIANGTAFGNGLITRSVDGRFILVGGYGTTLSTNSSGSVGTSLGTEIPRVIALVGADKVIDSRTALTNSAVDNQEPRGAASTDGTNIWAAGGTSGGFIEYAVLGTNDGTNLSVLNTRQLQIYSNQLYLSSAGFAGNPLGVLAILTNAFGTTLPMATNGVGNLGIGADTTNVFSGWGFAAFKLKAGGADPIDTLYILDAGSLSSGAAKFSLNGSTWVYKGNVGFPQNLVGLAANVTTSGSTTNVNIYVSGGGATLTGGDSVYKAIDSTGYDGTPTASSFAPLIGPLGAQKSFRGIAFAPTGNNGSLSGAGNISVGPVLGLFANGDTGCALSSSTATQTYSIANLGTTGPISWQGTSDVNWVSIVPASGSLASGGSVTVSAFFNANIIALPGSSDGVTNTATIMFTNTTSHIGDTTRAVRLIQHDQDISPSTPYNSAGQPLGPFSPLGKSYTVFNGSNNITLKVNTTSTWANVVIGTTTGSSVSVSMAGCTSTNVSVVVITNGVGGANSLAQGNYQSLICFSNTTVGSTLIDTRVANLTVGGLLFCDDFSIFNTGNLAGQQGWIAVGSGNEPVVHDGAVWVAKAGAVDTDEPYKNIPMLSNTIAYVAVSMTVTSAPPVTTPLSGGGAPSRMLCFFNQQNEGAFAVEYLSARDTGTGTFQFLIRGNSFTGYSLDPTPRAYGTKYNLIIGCETGITNMYLWVNPSSSTLNLGTTDVSWNTTDVGNSSNWRFGSYSIQNAFSGGGGPGGGEIPGVGVYKLCIETNYTDAYNDLPAAAPPTADFSGTPVSGVEPLQVVFTDASSGSPTSWAWDFNNDSINDSTVQNPTHIYAAGTYTVRLIACNGGGCTTNTKVAYISAITALQSWQNFYGVTANGSDPDLDGMSNTNEFLAGFNPNNNAAYLHIISVAKSLGTNIVVTYLGASGDSSYTGGPASRTNVLEFTTGTANGSYTNSFQPIGAGGTNILNSGTGLGAVSSFVDTNGASGVTKYYRVRVLVP